LAALAVFDEIADNNLVENAVGDDFA